MELVARGKMAHSAYPELGESAIEKLLDALESVRKLKLPTNPKAGPCTMNIGLIEGGRAPNVIPDYACAHLLFRLVGPARGIAPADHVRCRQTRPKPNSSWKSRTWNSRPCPASRP